ncbi:MAG TPA: hypothetical protein VMO81_04355 [Aestuariivirgaceae bacterium]|nr:hypothetical protein [Aestuariivirgaceae bacterium]
MKTLALIAALVIAAAACGGNVGVSPSPPLATQTPGATEMPSETEPPTMGVPQAILDLILNDAADRTGVPRDELQIERAQAVTWSDGSLGCPEPDKFYIQVLVDGYWVEVRAGDEVLDYRGSGRDFRLCPPGMGNPPQ